MLAKQLSQIATWLNELRGNERRILASTKPPDRANVSQITLRSEREYKGPMRRINEEESSEKYENGDKWTRWEGQMGNGDVVHLEDLRRPLPKSTNPFFLEEESEVKKDAKEDLEEPSKEVPSGEFKGTKPFPYSFASGKKKEDPVDFMSIFGNWR